MKNKLNLSLLAILIAGTTAISSCKKSSNTNEPEVPKPDSNESLADTFFEKVSYRGAFGTTDWTTGWTNYNPNATVYGATTDVLTGSITTNTTLDANKVYLLSGFVYVKEGVTLTIPAGTVIRGDKITKGTLVITRGAKLVAQGTVDKPIVFTSNFAPGQRNPGDWGGVIVLGKAPNNLPGGTGLIEGGLTLPEGNHGGTDPLDNSGILKYVRIEFPGIAFAKDNEINGLTLGSVGSGTTLDYIQVAYSGDDSFEWFGGTVNAKHLVSTANIDDVFDFDNGYSGKLQFLVGQRDPRLADQAGQSNGIESDNSAGDFVVGPRTRPVISNMTLIGPGNVNVDPKHEYANLWRRGSKMILANSIFIGFKWGIDIRDKETGDALTDGTSLIKNNIYQSFVAGKDIVADNNSFATSDLLKTYLLSKNNTIIDETASLALIANPFNATAPSFVLKSGSAAAAGATF